MEIGNIIPHIEALIFASDKPLTAMELTELANNAFGFMDEKLTLEQIQTAIDGIVEKYRSEFYPFEVKESGGGLQFLTKKEYHKTVAQLNGEKFLKRLSTAALETLSIIAYKQPVTKGEIEAIRGVSSDYAIQRLLEKELVVITGRNEKMPGHPLVYATSKSFMDYFGINSPDDLPKLKEIFDEAMVSPTIMDGGQGVTLNDENDQESSGNNELLAVTQSGELTTARINKDADKRNPDTAQFQATRDNDENTDEAATDNEDEVEVSETEVSEVEVSEVEVSEEEVSEEDISAEVISEGVAVDEIVSEEQVSEDDLEQERPEQVGSGQDNHFENESAESDESDDRDDPDLETETGEVEESRIVDGDENLTDDNEEDADDEDDEEDKSNR